MNRPASGETDLPKQIAELPVLKHDRIGHFKEPFGMEELEASTFTTFLPPVVSSATIR